MKRVLLMMLLLGMVLTSAAQTLPVELDSLMSRSFPADKPGGALYVQLNGKTVYQKGFGLADLTNGKAVTPETTFRLASVTKQFTAMCILLLDKQKKLSVDDPLLQFFPAFNPVLGKKITVRHLLTHTSGLVDYETLLAPDRVVPVSDAEVLALVGQRVSTYFEPGTDFRYSNTGYCLLEQIVEKTAKQPFSTFLKQNIFDPLGMTATRLYEPQLIIPNRAMGYAEDESGAIQAADQSVTSATKGDGCIYTSIKDYQKWLEALDQNRLVNLPAALSRISQPLGDGTNAFYGCGWFQYRPEDADMEYFHSGSTSEFSTFVVRVPGQKLAIVLFSNLANNTNPFAEVLDIITAISDNPPRIDVWAMHDLTR